MNSVLDTGLKNTPTTLGKRAYGHATTISSMTESNSYLYTM